MSLMFEQAVVSCTSGVGEVVGAAQPQDHFGGAIRFRVATFVPPRGRPLLVVLSLVASSPVASLSSASFCDAAAACRLPVPCSRCFLRLSAQLRPPCCISWPLESIELSSSKDESSDAHCDHLPPVMSLLRSTLSLFERKKRKKTDNPREGWEDGTPVSYTHLTLPTKA